MNSDRQIRHIHDSDGGDWNSWLLQSELPALYISLLEAITRTRVPGCSVYDYWPRYSNRNTSDISSILTTKFWQNIVESDCSAKIFPIQRSITGNLQTITAAEEEYVSYREARFNLLEPDYRTLCDSFLPKLDLGDWKLIKPFNEAQKGLQKLVWAKKQAINHISPSFMAELFKSQSNANVLMRCWKSNYHSDIGFINRLLKFILTEATPDMLMGCMILPLGDNSLGCLQAMANGSQKFPVLPFDSLIESTVLQEVPNALVHPGLDSGVLGKLVSGNRLNVSHFSPADLPRLFERFSGKSQQCMKLFLEGVWKWYNQMQAQSSEAQKALIMLTDLNCLIATTPGALSEYCFLSLRSFRTFESPAILGEPLGLSGQMRVEWDFQALRTVLRSFQGDGLLLVDQDAFPWHLHSEESLENNKGIYRFLRCIEAMAYRKQQTVEAFIRSKFHEDPEYPVVGNILLAALYDQRERLI